MSRNGEMFELANLASFLMADGCDYLTGQTIAIDGGMHLAAGGNFRATRSTRTIPNGKQSAIRSAPPTTRTKRNAACRKSKVSKNTQGQDFIRVDSAIR